MPGGRPRLEDRPTAEMLGIEARYGKPLLQVLPELYEKHGGQEGVAQELGVDRNTVGRWFIRLGLRFKTILVHEDRD